MTLYMGIASCTENEHVVYQEKARAYFESTPPADRHTCSMCGKMCAVRTTNLILEGKKVEFCSEL